MPFSTGMMLVFSARKPEPLHLLGVAREVVVAVQWRHAHQLRAAHTVGAEMRPVDRDAIADRPAEQRRDRHAVGLAGHVQQRVLDRRDRLLVDAAARLPGDDVQVLGDLFVAAWIAADQHGGEAADHVGEADRAEALVEFGPADDAVVGGDLEEREHAPAGIGLQRFDAPDLHAMPLEASPQRRKGTKMGFVPLRLCCEFIL